MRSIVPADIGYERRDPANRASSFAFTIGHSSLRIEKTTLSYTPAGPGNPLAPHDSLLRRAQLAHRGARPRIEGINTELNAADAACEGMIEQQVLGGRVDQAAAKLRMIISASASTDLYNTSGLM